MLTYLIGGISRALQQGNSTRNRALCGSDVVVERYYLKNQIIFLTCDFICASEIC